MVAVAFTLSPTRVFWNPLLEIRSPFLSLHSSIEPNLPSRLKPLAPGLWKLAGLPVTYFILRVGTLSLPAGAQDDSFCVITARHPLKLQDPLTLPV